MRKFNILAAKKYPKQDGTEGTKWIKLGTVVQKDDGTMFGDLDSLPTGSWFDGSIQLYPQEQQGQNNQNTSARTPNQQRTNNYNANQGNYNQNNYGHYQG